MSLKRRIKKLLEKLTHTRIYRHLPRGVDVAHDIATSLPIYRSSIVFDVGANVGQSAKSYLGWFPESQIYCFEPVRDTFNKLEENLRGSDRIHCFQLALGSSRGTGKMILRGTSDVFFLSGLPKESSVTEGMMTEDVNILTLDEFCRTRTIDQINYLKIDTEGGDLEVLRGAESMLSEQRIDLVEVEAGMNTSNKWHVPFEVLKEHLESRRYFLFGIYEQVNEWPMNEPHLRRTNPVFVSRRMIEANRRTPPQVTAHGN